MRAIRLALLALAVALAACSRMVVPGGADDIGRRSADVVAVDLVAHDTSHNELSVSTDTGLDTAIAIDGETDESSTDASALPSACTEVSALRPIALPEDLFTDSVSTVVPVAGCACFTFATPDAGAPPDDAPGNAYALHLASRTGVIISVVPERGNAMAVLSVRHVCADSRSEVACTTRERDNQANLQTVLDAGEYAIVVTGMPSGSRYRIAVHTFDPPANVACESGTAITAETTLFDQRFSGAPAHEACPYPLRSAVHYTVTVPPGQTAIVGVVPTSRPLFEADFVVRDACDDSCGRYVDGSSGYGVDLANTGPATRTFHVEIGDAIHSYDRTARSPQAGRFDLYVTMRPNATNTTVATATRVADGTRILDEPIGGGASAFLGGESGSWRFYRASIGPSETMVALAEPHGAPSEWPTILVRDPDTGEALPRIRIDEGDASGASYSNDGTSARDVVFAIGEQTNPGSTRAGRFDAWFTLRTPPVNDRCDEAAPLSAASTFPTSAAIAARPSTCSAYNAQRAYFTVDVPPGRMIAPPWSSVATFAACDAPCSHVAPINDGPTTRTALLVHSVYPDQPSSLRLENARVTLRDAPRDVVPTDDCTAAVAFTPGEVLRADLPREVWRSRSAFFRTTIPPHSMLRIESRQGEGVLELRDSCGAPLLWSSLYSVYDSPTLPFWMEYANAADTPLAVILAARYSRPGDAMLITTDLVGRVGLGTPIATDCDEMSTATSTTDVYPHHVSRRIPMPFPFEYRGEMITSFASEGALALYRGDDKVVARLAPGGGPTVRTFGVAPHRRLTLQGTVTYSRYSNTDSGGYWPPYASITVQVKLLESTNAIEFHYCSFTWYQTVAGGTIETGSDRVPTGSTGGSGSSLRSGDGLHNTILWETGSNLPMDYRAMRFLPEDE